MYVPSSQMPPHSRVWIYQSNRELTAEEINLISAKAKEFLETWTAHEQKLKASFEILYNHFIILMIDEQLAGASGCSIDKSVHFMKSLETTFNISLFDRLLFAYKKNNKVNTVSRLDFEKKLASNELNDDTIVFNNLIQTKNALQKNWEIPLKDSWHKTLG